MSKIFLNASEIAIITGDNKYQYLSDYIIKLFEKNFPKDVQKLHTLIQHHHLKSTKSENAVDCVKRISQSKDLNISESLNKCLESKDVKELNKKQEHLKKEIQSNKKLSQQKKP